jgi:hypothetical protein
MFTWRRADECLNFNGSFVVGEKSDCTQEDEIVIAAYGWSDGNAPFQNIGTLLKEFVTRVKVNQWYTY